MQDGLETFGKKGDVSWRMLVNWMEHNGFNEHCSELHPNTSCTHEVLLKFFLVAKNNNLFYLIIHLIPFLLRIKKLKNKSRSEILYAVLKLIKRYLGSMLFMSTLVAGIRALLCVRAKVGSKTIFPWFSIPGLVICLGLFFQDSTRRKEITVYAFVRSIPSAYSLLKKRGILRIPHVDCLVFVGLFGILSLCYYKFEKQLAYNNFFQKILGQQ